MSLYFYPKSLGTKNKSFTHFFLLVKRKYVLLFGDGIFFCYYGFK